MIPVFKWSKTVHALDCAAIGTSTSECIHQYYNMSSVRIFWLQGVASNILNKQSQTADKGLSSSLGVGRGVDNPSL
jgi:hypothetical protein